MGKNRKTILYIAVGVIGLIIIILLLRFLIINHYRSRIPELPNSVTLSQPVQQQILAAHDKARRRPSADNLGMLGMVYHSSANYEQAEQCYNLAIRRDKSEWIWNYYLGYLNLEMGESGAVIENFHSVIEKNPGIDLAWYYTGEEYVNLGENELAEEAFGNIADKKEISPAKNNTRTDHFPLSIHARYQLSRLYFETGRTDMAEKTLKEILEENRSFGPAYRLLGNIYSVKGDSTLNKKYGVRANDLLVLSPPVDTLIDRLAMLSRSELYLLKKIDEAQRGIYSEWTQRLVDQALQYMPDNKYLISKAIDIYLWVGADEKAITFTDQHISYFKESLSEMRKIGMLFFMNGLYPQSLKYLTIASQLEPEYVELQKNLAISYWYVGDRQKSQDILNVLLEENHDNPDILADVANILFFNFRENDKAAGILTGLMQMSPSNPKVQKLAAGVAEQNGEIQKAITLYEASFRSDPEDLTTIRFLGNLLFNQGMWDRSIRHYREALEYHPNDPDFLESLGTLLIACPDTSLRNMEEGIEYCERAFNHISTRPNIAVSAGRSLAWAYAKLGDKQHAISIISQTINIARRENISRSYQAELENLYRTFQHLPD